MVMKAELLNPDLPQAILGESPFWDVATHTLYWVDIKGKKIYRYHPTTQKISICRVSRLVGFAMPVSATHVIAGLQDGLYKIDLEDAAEQELAPLPSDNGVVRFNDGKCDVAGRIWAGTMALDESSNAALGALYRCTGNGIVEIDAPYGIANGKGWSPDGTVFYHIDTPAKTIWRFRYDAMAGTITGKERFVTLDDPPDGMCVDAHGNLYVALYGAGRVAVITPEGKDLRSIEVPTPNVTSCGFGGADLKTLYITTAADETGSAQPATLGGHLFAAQMDVAGMADHRPRGFKVD